MTGRFGHVAIIALGLAAFAASAPARAAPPEAFPVATEIRIGGDDAQTRFVLDLTRKVELRAFTLADPYRVVIDLPQVTFALPAKAGHSGRGLVKAYRYGLVMAGGSRIVIDVAKPVRVDKVTMLDATPGVPARLVLDLAAIDRASFMRTLALDNKSAHRRGRNRRPRRAARRRRPIRAHDRGRSRTWRTRYRRQGARRRA